MTTGCDVFCLGSAVADVLALPVESLPPRGTTIRMERIVLAPGGNGLLTSIALARLGASVRLAAAVGNDPLGRIIREAVRRAGVDDANLVTLDVAPTAVTVALVSKDGEHRFLHYLGANARFASPHLDWERVRGARFFHYASAFALPAFDAELAETLARARQLGCLTSLNPCWDPYDRWVVLLGPALAHTDLIFPNLEEGRELTGETEPQKIAACLRRMGARTVVVKMGEAGCFVAGPDGEFLSPGFPVKPVDTTGAGDCFAAGFLAALSAGQSPEEAARLANAAAALSVTAMGGAEAAPTLSQARGFLAQRAGEQERSM